MSVYITIQPNPCTPPCWVLVCYDFDNLPANVTNVILSVDFSPDAVDDTQLQPTRDEPCVPLWVPGNATSGLITDNGGYSEVAAMVIE